MMLDANILLYATDSSSPRFDQSWAIVSSLINGSRRVAIPSRRIGASVLVGTTPRIYLHPSTGAEAWARVEGWLARDVTWIPPATEATARVYGEIARRTPVTGNLVPDAMLAALAIEHGLELWSADTDFARFPGLRWRNPLDDDMSGD